MKNIRALALKLQKALCMRGENISFEEKRFYSIVYRRMLTKYIIRRYAPGRKRETLLETYKLSEAVLKLAELYRETGGGENE